MRRCVVAEVFGGSNGGGALRNDTDDGFFGF